MSAVSVHGIARNVLIRQQHSVSGVGGVSVSVSVSGQILTTSISPAPADLRQELVLECGDRKLSRVLDVGGGGHTHSSHHSIAVIQQCQHSPVTSHLRITIFPAKLNQ